MLSILKASLKVLDDVPLWLYVVRLQVVVQTQQGISYHHLSLNPRLLVVLLKWLWIYATAN